MRSLKKAAALALAITAAVVGTAVAQDQSTQQGTSPGWTWGPRGMMGYGFMGPGYGLWRNGPWDDGRVSGDDVQRDGQPYRRPPRLYQSGA